MKFLLFLLFFTSNMLLAIDEITDEINKIKNFALQQSLIFEEDLIDMQEDLKAYDFWSEIFKDTIKELIIISDEAHNRLIQIDDKKNLFMAKIYLQQLRNRIYSLHANKEELLDYNINRRSESLFKTSKKYISNSAAFIIKIGTLMAAMQSIYNYLPSFNQDN